VSVVAASAWSSLKGHWPLGSTSSMMRFGVLVSDELTTRPTLAKCSLRFDIEEPFLDDQLNSWNLSTSVIRSFLVLSKRWLILALSRLAVRAQGTGVITSSKRRWVEPHGLRGKSCFCIVWEWVKTAFHQAWR